MVQFVKNRLIFTQICWLLKLTKQASMTVAVRHVKLKVTSAKCECTVENNGSLEAGLSCLLPFMFVLGPKPRQVASPSCSVMSTASTLRRSSTSVNTYLYNHQTTRHGFIAVIRWPFPQETAVPIAYHPSIRPFVLYVCVYSLQFEYQSKTKT